MSAVILPFKPRALLRSANEHEREMHARVLLNEAENLVINFGLCPPYQRAVAHDRAKEAFDAAAESIAQLDVYLRTLCARVKPHQQWAFTKGEIAVSWQVAKAMIEELRTFLLRIDRNFTSLLKRRPFFRGETLARHYVVAREANHNSMRAERELARAERKAARLAKKEALPMGRPLAPSLVWKHDHFAFRCRVKDGGRPWIPLPPGLTKEAAAAMALEIATLASAGELAMTATKAPITKAETFSEWSERWLEARRARGIATVRNDRSRLTTHVLPVLGERPMVKVSKAEIEDLVSRLDARVQARTLSWKTAVNVWGAVTKAFDDAANAKDRTLRCRADNPCDGVRGPDRGVRKVKVFLYPSEVSALLTCDAVPLVFRQAAALAVYLGVRAGELRSLTWDDVDMDHGTIHVHQGFDRDTHAAKSTKSKMGRRFTFDAEVRPLLEALRKRSKGKGPVLEIPRFFKTADDLRQHLRTAGVTRPDLFVTDETRKNLTFHDLRATALTWMAVRGDDVLRIKARAGHSDLKQTEGYVRTAGEIEGSIGRVFAPLPACVVAGMDQNLGPYSAEIAGNIGKNAVAEEGLEPPPSTPEVAQTPGDVGGQRQDIAGDDRGFSGAGPSIRTESDPVETALAAALERASLAGEWSAVKALADELTTRRNARAGVVDIGEARRAREGR